MLGLKGEPPLLAFMYFFKAYYASADELGRDCMGAELWVLIGAGCPGTLGMNRVGQQAESQEVEFFYT